jgi:hypothetical protein
MTIYDLVFIVGFLCTVSALIVAVVQALRGRRRQAGRTLVRTAVAVAAYLTVVVLVSLATPRRILPQSERRCWDEWCLAVERVTRTDSIGPSVVATPGDVLYVVDVRVSNLGRGRRQRERGVVLYLLDASAVRYDPDLEGERALAAFGLAGDPLDSPMAPGGSFVHRVAFRVPRNAAGLGLVKEGTGPAAFVIADNESLFHKRTMTRLDVVENGK